MDIQDVTRRVLAQRMNRYPDSGPLLGAAGDVRYRQEGVRMRVGFANLFPGRAGEAVARVQRSALARGQGLHWVVVPQRAGERELPAALLAAGFHLAEDLLLMAHEGPIVAEVSAAVTAGPVGTWQAMMDYEYGSRQSFFDDSQPTPQVVMQRARDRWREQEHGWCRYYSATLDGRMAGGCYISLFEDIPTLMGVYTLPPARCRGVATALVARAVADTVRPGRPYCCLFVRHGNPAERLYARLGFVEVADERTYVWEPTEMR